MQLGITPTCAIQTLYEQILLNEGMPSELKPLYTKPVAIGGMSKAEIDSEIQKGIDSIDTTPSYTEEQIKVEFFSQFA